MLTKLLWLKWFLVVLAVFIAQTTITFFGIPLSLGIVLVYAFLLKTLYEQAKVSEYQGMQAELKGTAFGMGTGMVEDLLAGSIVGPGIFSKGLIGFAVAALFSDAILRWSPLVGAVLITVMTFTDGLLIMLLRVLFSETNINRTDTLFALSIQMLINIPFGLLLKPRSEGP
jgi:cell shape-determining protein MreD